MKTKYIWIIFTTFIICSCEKDDNSNENLSKNPPETPEAVSYDLNDDSVNDIKIEYRWFTWDGINSSGDGISGLIEPLNESSILLKQNEYTLFNKLNDTIRINTTEPYYWEKYLAPAFVSISNSSVNDYLWPSEWKIQSNLNLDSYYLGIVINNSNNNLIGWIKITINKSTGDVQILDKKFTTEEFIVIEK
ncbi:hypothetical protein ACE1ET_20310 [Saccharicrinis sp. FJH62]|uniref:hypothetical protein n=1 Tax=Saccharicrinis sp. FJH62 TaxID=3344657 RepID=UPI0035D46D1C